jgi:hypothetical protein
MAEIINLKRARKAKDRAEKDKTAQANRIAHGTSKTLKKLSEARAEKAEKGLSGHKLENPSDDNRSVRESESDQK